VHPAHERLGADDFTRDRIELGLELEEDLVVAEGAFELAEQGDARMLFGAEIGSPAKDIDADLPRVPCRGLRAADQGAGVGAVQRADRTADHRPEQQGHRIGQQRQRQVSGEILGDALDL
jgi:hypothetical protein